MGLPHAETPLRQPREIRPIGRDRLTDDRFGRERDGTAGLAETREIFRVLSAGTAEREVEAAAGKLRR